MELNEIRVTSRMIEVRGITLPFERRDYHNRDKVIETGEVFISMDALYELAEQEQWDSQVGKILLFSTRDGLALTQAGLAIEETKGGYHRSEKLIKFLKKLETK